jgi:TIGR03009 family protein
MAEGAAKRHDDLMQVASNCLIKRVAMTLLLAALLGQSVLAQAQAPQQRQQPQGPGGQVAGPQPPPGYAPSAPGQYPPAGPTARPAASPVQQAPPAAARAPFELSAQEHAALNSLLLAWEQHSAQVNTFSARIVRYEYNPVFKVKDQSGQEIPTTQSRGIIKYGTPDKAMLKIEEVDAYDTKLGKFVPQSDDTGQGRLWWICDGKSTFEFNYLQRQVIERTLPPEMQGKAIAEGPLPFLFGAKAERLKQRYFLRLVTPPTVQGQYWLEAFPRFQADASNFYKAQLILTSKDLMPQAIQITEPDGKTNTVYVMTDIKVNEFWAKILPDFAQPKVPIGWKRVVNPEQAATQQVQGPAPPRR